MQGLLESGWWAKALKLPLKQACEVNACMVAVLWSDDLDTNRQSITGKSCRSDGGWQVCVTRVTRPEHLGRRGLRFAVDHDHTLPTLTFLVVSKSCGGGSRAGLPVPHFSKLPGWPYRKGEDGSYPPQTLWSCRV